MGERRIFRSGRGKGEAKVEPEAVVAPVVEGSPMPDGAPVAVPPGSPQAVDESIVRAPKTVHGVISTVALGTRGDAPALEVSLSSTDANTGEDDRVTLVWLGRTKISGIELGREVVATARVCDEAGVRVMYNPRYDLR